MLVHVFISGFVQGVGFRAFILRQAQDLRLTGWVRNLKDNRVEAVFQSSAGSDQEAKEQIEKMITICEKGPFLSEVKDVVVEWRDSPAETFKNFEILR